VDTTKCIGCKACITACSQTNEIPEGLWRKLNQPKEPPSPERKRLFATRSCMHCQDPPCNTVCPTGATHQRPDGIVDIDPAKCVGCSYCILACPYEARTLYNYSHFFDEDHALTATKVKKRAKKKEGVCTKCNFCAARIEGGLERGLQPGLDDDATPMCVVNCSCGALYFGDLDDDESNVSNLLKKRLSYKIVASVETNPSVYYLIE
jgi:phenylacetyl-CoA:acceptor oxidoreductase subunit 1